MASTPLVFSSSFNKPLHHRHRPFHSFQSPSLHFKFKHTFHYSNCITDFPSNPKLLARASSEEHAELTDSSLVGEESATFEIKDQKLSSWFYFTLILGVVLFVLNVIWIDDSTGFGKAFVDSISGISDSHEVILFFLFFFFLYFTWINVEIY